MSHPWTGFERPTRKVSWLRRDTLLFNLSIGCKADEPQFVYEGHGNFATFPTFPLGLVFKLDSQEVIDFYATQGAVKIPGVPDLDPRHLVDGDRTLQILKPLPVTSQGRSFEFRTKILDVGDKGKAGTVVRSEDALVDTVSGEVYAKNIGSLFYVGQGNWGGPRGAPSQKYPPPKGAPDISVRLKIDEESAHLYRLNGDYNPLHATPEFGKQMGYGGLINHGVYAYQLIAHEIVRRLGQGNSESLKEISARFAGPVKPGDAVDVDIWKLEAQSGGKVEIRWTAKVVDTGRVCLSDGMALVVTERLSAKI